MNTPRAVIVPRRAERAALTWHIERVVLDGLPFDATQARHLQLALERELARLCAQPAAGASPRGFAAPALRAPPLATSGAAGDTAAAARVGRDAARSLFAILRLE
jgi:hypothetical protein